MSQDVSAGARTSMRHGLISLLTVVIVLSLATAAVLAVSTARAMSAIATRQATMATEGYAAETSAQGTLAGVDEMLYEARETGLTGDEARALVRERVGSVASNACVEGVSATTTLDYDVLTCVYVTTNGRMLEVRVVLNDDLRYEVVGWVLTAVPEEEEIGGDLWTGFAD